MSEDRAYSMDDEIFVNMVLDEVSRARTKFPNNSGLLAALTEEVGELARALMDQTDSEVYNEAVQVAAMALRIAIEDDPSLREVRKFHALLRANGELP
jgi:NTP pyrophosphatase (non-canonical NTP hydrolase)